MKPGGRRRIALGGAIDGGKGRSRPLQRRVRFALVGMRARPPSRIAGDIGGPRPGSAAAAPSSSTARERARARIDRSSPAEAPINRTRREGARDSRAGSCPASRGDREKHRESGAPRRGDPREPSSIRERPMPGASAPGSRSFTSPRLPDSGKARDAKSFRLSVLNVAARLPTVRAGRPGLRQTSVGRAHSEMEGLAAHCYARQ